ncbi:MAG: TetR/AcrR family transcriptional regulator [Kiritimatiellae bacterium]|nr:TetR/AcrR family transcriptional regulator [Kiritimatiellia bacterium]
MATRVKQRDAERTRRRILKAAAALFGRRGYAGASARDIAARAGIRAATMYHYFSSKQRILHEIFVTLYADLAALYRAIHAELPAACPLERGLRVFMARHRRFLASNRDAAYLFFVEGLRPGAPLSRRLRGLARESTAELERLAARWPGLSRERALTLFMGVISMNLFFAVAHGYLATAVRIHLPHPATEELLAGLVAGGGGLERRLAACGTAPWEGTA